MKIRNLLSLAVLIGAVTATGLLLADDDEHKTGSARALPPVANAQWQAECASCHMAYHPGLLPARSWRQIMANLDKHFGENASLDKATAEEITRFLVQHSADNSPVRRSQKIAASIPAGKTPVRITETPWFRAQHDEISPAVWKRQKIGSPANCVACHQGAERGDFSEERVRIPR